MNKKKKLGIKTLGYPLWFNILFFCLTILAPIILVVIEGLKAPGGIAGTAFKFSFMTLCILIIAWFFIKKLLINKMETKLIAKQSALEHDYSIDNGDLDKIKYLWYQNEKKLAIFQLVSILLYGGLLIVILMGVASALMQIRGIIMLIGVLYVIAYTIKFMILIMSRGGDKNENENADSTEDE